MSKLGRNREQLALLDWSGRFFSVSGGFAPPDRIAMLANVIFPVVSAFVERAQLINS
jgi:hypothetical protein